MRLFTVLGLLFAALMLGTSARAEVGQYTLDCSYDRRFPSGVPGTFTSRNNLKIFRHWCDHAGTKTLKIYIAGEVDPRTFELSGLSMPSRVTKTLSETLPQTIITEFEDNSGTAPKKASTSYPLTVKDPGGSGNTFTFVSYNKTTGDVTYRIAADGTLKTDTIANWLGVCSGSASNSCLWEEEEKIPGERTYNKKKISAKPACPVHRTYVFVNSMTGEATSNFINGGSCFRITNRKVTVVLNPE